MNMDTVCLECCVWHYDCWCACWRAQLFVSVCVCDCVCVCVCESVCVCIYEVKESVLRVF